MGLKAGADPDAAPACPEQPFLKLGDLVLLGRHRLLVGDSTKRAEPYNVDYQSDSASLKAEGKGSIKNDAMTGEQFQAFLDATFARYAEATGPHAAFYVFYPSRFHVEFEGAMLRAGVTVRAQIIWAKTQASFGFSQYKWKHEPILLGAKDGETPLIYLPAHETAFYAFKAKQAPFWTGDRTQTTVWTCARETGYVHPTQKPVELLRKPITNSSRVGMLVLDLFGGSGSTLITCESMGRRCNTMELDPKFSEVIWKRWEEATGKKATVLRDGQPVEAPRARE
jgi:DNA modification methylase